MRMRSTVGVAVAVVLMVALLLINNSSYNNQHPTSQQQQGQRRTEDNNTNDEKWHPDKSEVDCAVYWQQRNMTQEGPPQDGDDDEFVPCRLMSPFLQGNNMSVNGNGFALGQAARPTDLQGEEPPEQQVDLPPNIVQVNISIAIPFLSEATQNGIPRRLTTVVKDYLNSTDVKAAFWQKEYPVHNRHFAIQVVEPPANMLAQQQQQQQDDNNNGGQRLLRRHLLNDDTANTSHLALVGISPRKGHLVAAAPNTPFAWYYHVIYFLVNEADGDDDDDDDRPNNVTTTRRQPVTDPDLMEWLQLELSGIVYDDIHLRGPLGPYYDTNNYFVDDNNPYRQISFIEWSVQQAGIPIGGVAIPGQEDFDLALTYYGGGSTSDTSDSDTGPSIAAEVPFGTVPVDGEDPASPELEQQTEPPMAMTTVVADTEEEDDVESESQRVYYQPLSTSFGPRQWLGLAGLLGTLVSAITLTLVSNELAKRRQQDEIWGNLMIFEKAQEEEEYLHVGWRFAMTDTDGMQPNNDNNKNNNGGGGGGIPENYMMMEVFEKTGLGYKDGSSLLMGGYEYKSTTAMEDTEVPTDDSTPPPQANQSYRASVSVSPFG